MVEGVKMDYDSREDAVYEILHILNGSEFHDSESAAFSMLQTLIELAQLPENATIMLTSQCKITREIITLQLRAQDDKEEEDPGTEREAEES